MLRLNHFMHHNAILCLDGLLTGLSRMEPALTDSDRWTGGQAVSARTKIEETRPLDGVPLNDDELHILNLAVVAGIRSLPEVEMQVPGFDDLDSDARLAALENLLITREALGRLIRLTVAEERARGAKTTGVPAELLVAPPTSDDRPDPEQDPVGHLLAVKTGGPDTFDHLTAKTIGQVVYGRCDPNDTDQIGAGEPITRVFFDVFVDPAVGPYLYAAFLIESRDGARRQAATTLALELNEVAALEVAENPYATVMEHLGVSAVDPGEFPLGIPASLRNA